MECVMDKPVEIDVLSMAEAGMSVSAGVPDTTVFYRRVERQKAVGEALGVSIVTAPESLSLPTPGRSGMHEGTVSDGD